MKFRTKKDCYLCESSLCDECDSDNMGRIIGVLEERIEALEKGDYEDQRIGGAGEIT